jgi:hypothetical protein
MSSKKDRWAELVRQLPTKEQGELKRDQLTVEDLEERIEKAGKAMQRDLYVGLPWFVAYSASLVYFGLSVMTLGIFVLGMVYFVYSFTTSGSYGLNRRRIKVYEEMKGLV